MLELEIKNINYMKSLNAMNCIYDNKLNNIAEYNLLHDILNPSKKSEHRNIHYYPILHGNMNTCRGKAKFKYF